MDSQGVAFSWGSGGNRWDGAGALGLGDLEGVNFLVPTPTEITTMSGVGAKVGIYARASMVGRHVLCAVATLKRGGYIARCLT